MIGTRTGSRLQIGGPWAGQAVMVLEAIEAYGLKVLGPIVLIAGALQAAAGMAKLGQVFRAVSPAVINGMLAGIGVLIFSTQFHVAVDDSPKGSGIDNLVSIPEQPEVGGQAHREQSPPGPRRFADRHASTHRVVDSRGQGQQDQVAVVPMCVEEIARDEQQPLDSRRPTQQGVTPE